MTSKTTFRDIAKERSWLQDALADPEQALAEFEEAPIPGFENLQWR